MKSFLSLLLVILISAPSYAITPLSLSQAKERVTQSPRMTASQASYREAQSTQQMSKGMFYPSLTAKESFYLTNDPVNVFSSKLRQGEFTAGDFALPALNDPSSLTHWATRIEVVQPLLHSTIDIKNRKASKRAEEAAGYRHEYRLQQMRLSVSQIYFTAAAFKEKQRMVNEGIDLLEKLEKSYQLMSAPTAATTTSYLITQSVRLELAAQQRILASAETNLKRKLGAILGLPSTETVVLTDPLPSTVSSRQKKQQTRRLDVLATEREMEAAKASLGATKGEWGPTLDAIGGYNLYTGKWSNFKGSYDVALMFNWPLFQGPRLGKVDLAKARLIAARQMSRSAGLEAESDRINAEAELAAHKDAFQLISSAESKASQAFDLAKMRYAEGILSLFDYSRSIQNWVMVRQGRVEAQRRLAEADAKLLFELGAL